MPDITTTTITALTALAETPANNDLLALDDTSATATKSIAAAYMRRFKYDAVIATGSLTPNAMQLVTLNLGTAIALTISGSPTIGDILVIQRLGSGAVTHTAVLGSGIDWDASGNGTANFADDGDTLIAIAITATRWLVVLNTGVTFSA
jgi:hypothetical protein